MKKAVTTFIFFSIVTAGFTQQEPQFSQNMFNRLVINPGYAGSNEAICAGLIGRNQWTGFLGAPKTGLLGVDAPVHFLHGGAGLSLYSDKLGVEYTTGLKASYSFRTTVGVGKLGIGVSGGFINKTLDGPSLAPVTDDGSDKVIPNSAVTDMVANFGAGIYYQTDFIYLGVSATQLSESALDYKWVQSNNQNGGINYLLPRHYYGIAGYNFRVAAALELEPSLLAKWDGVTSPQVDVNALGIYNDFLFGGFSYRYQDAIVSIIGIRWNNFKIAYSYDINTSSLRGYNSGTHELFAGYCFKLPEGKTAQRYKNVRFL